MSTISLRNAHIIGLVAILFGTLSFVPVPAHAVGTAADAMCVGDPADKWPTDANKNGVIGVIGKPCSDVTSGFTTAGTCVTVQKCLGKTGGGSPLGDASQILGLAKQIMDMLKGGQGGGGAGAGSGMGTTPAGTPGCTTYYQVATPTSDPCAIYQPSSNINADSVLPLNTSSDLLDALSGDTTDTGSITGLLDLSDDAPKTPAATPAPTATTTKVPAVSGTPGVIMPGVSGDIRIIDGGATVIINNKNTEANTQVAGFYGTSAGTQQPQGLVANMCISRPWASNFLTYIIPPSFFDSICSLRGYQVGKAQTAPTVVVQTSTAPKPAPKPVSVPTTTPLGPVIPPEADIWAVPTSVPLGARTTIFWSAKGVTACTVSSPDGSFSQKSLAGGAATVPLAGPTTFTISCDTAEGKHVTNYTTVNLAN